MAMHVSDPFVSWEPHLCWAHFWVWLASLIGQESCDNLKQFFLSYTELTPGHTYTWAGFIHTLWYFARFPLLLLLAGFSALGVIAIPAALLWKGFSFSFAVSALVLLYGWPGLLAAAVFFGLADFVLIPILFSGRDGIGNSPATSPLAMPSAVGAQIQNPQFCCSAPRSLRFL